MKPKKNISSIKAILIFMLFTGYFFLLLFTLLPFLKSHFFFNPAVYWFITGYFLFIPMVVYALLSVKKEGNRGIRQIMVALNIRPMTKKDWKFSIIGLVSVLALTGIIFGIYFFLNKYFGVRMINTTPWFMEIHPFVGIQRLLLLIWLPMFFFNIAGEEILWRGYIQSRLKGKYSWLLCSLLWWGFHIPFGFDLMIMVSPTIFIVPYLFNKTRNTLVGMIIHSYNAPVFIAIALGLIR